MSHPTERCELTNLCMITDAENRILVQDRTDPSWPGICFPGGHVEPGESFVASVIREVQEETGLTIQDPILCGVKQFPREDGARYVVLLFRATRFTGTLTSSSEGKMLWLTREELKGRHLTSDFLEMLRVFENPTLSEFYYYQPRRQPFCMKKYLWHIFFIWFRVSRWYLSSWRAGFMRKRKKHRTIILGSSIVRISGKDFII